jgi:hypothetical protein
MKILLSFVITILTAVSLFAQTYAPMPPARQQFFDANGKPLAGGKLFSYSAGTSTPLSTYGDATGSVNANPLILDSGGFGTVFLGPQAYKIVLQNSLGVQQWSVDSIVASNVLPTLTTVSAQTLTLSGNMTFANGAVCGVSGCSGMIFPSSASFNGGLTTLGNSSIQIGSGGNFYTRTFSGGDPSCAGIADGWIGMRTDNHTIQFCAGSTLYSIGGSSGGAGPTLAGTNTWTGVNTHTAAVNFNGGATTCTSTDGSSLLGGCQASFSTGTAGNLYIRTFTGGDASCGGRPDGWFGLRLDVPKLETCVGGVLKVIALT